MNLIEEFKKGQSGGNKGLPMGDGLANVSKAVNGVQKGRMYGFAGASKSGKSTVVDYAMVLEPFLYSILSENKTNTKWIYFSFELNRISKEFDFATFFLYHDFGIEKIKLEEGITYTTKNHTSNIIDLSPDYLRGRLQDDNGDTIKVKEEIQEALKVVYENRIIPLFGEYDAYGNQIKKGLITFVTNKDNPTGIYKYLLDYARNRGAFVNDSKTANRITSYIPNDENEHIIIIVDHMRKILLERGFQMKQAVDKMSEYLCDIRDWCNYTVVPIIHTNRDITSIDNIRFAKDELYPTSEHLKDTGNIAEDCDYLFTIFNPNDEKYKLEKHFGLSIRDSKGNPIYPNMRTLHLVESRHCIFPQHFRTEMLGNLKSFKQINIKN